MGRARVKKKRHAAVKTSPDVEKSAEKSATVSPLPAAPSPVVGKPFTGVDDPRNGKGPAPGAPNAGRPPNAVRATFREILKNEGATAAKEVLLGEPDKQGRVPEHHERRNWLRELAEIGFNERLRTAKLRADASATAGAKAQAGVQLILQGGPAGNLKAE